MPSAITLRDNAHFVRDKIFDFKILTQNALP